MITDTDTAEWRAKIAIARDKAQEAADAARAANYELYGIGDAIVSTVVPLIAELAAVKSERDALEKERDALQGQLDVQSRTYTK
ncbi:MAG: hypothetical protein O7D91_17570 [Planctomycetota bacterium]|nr:hypothetical protein [Planctomycetota bacterium]